MRACQGWAWVVSIFLTVILGCKPVLEQKVETSFVPVRDTPTLSMLPSPSEVEVKLYDTDATPITPFIDGRLQVYGSIAHLALGEHFIFVPSHDGRKIKRVPLNGKGTPTEVVSSYFEKGTLDSFNLIWKKPWLVFLDVNFGAQNFHWIIRAYNVETGKNIDVLEIQDPLSWPGPEYDFDGENIAISYNAYDSAKDCQASFLVVFNIQEQRSVQIDKHCAEYGPFIWGPVAIHGNVLVTEQDLPQKEGSINRIVFFRKQGQRWRIYYREDTGYNSMPVLSWPWLVWKADRRYAYGRHNKAYNFATGQYLIIRVPQGGRASDPQICNHWVIWSLVEHSSSQAGIDGSVYFFKLPAGPFLKYIKTTTKGGSFSRFACNENGLIAWSYAIGPRNTLVEWGRIDGQTP